ncbi:hypothetical protein [Acidomonas methanolica]|uniref:hypothetical protein n=1 Tax=Acidomonas methanolica TaxID=437 RepID=UPI002119F4E1|nr:hypothetical protein [Acidomonas methanolica]MCQ9155135.1 hypothetical protein [Acidomonas methanolica]
MSIVPVGDCEIIVLSPEQFGALMNEDRKVARPAGRPLLGALQPWNTPAPSMLSTSLPWNRGTASPRPRPDPITEVNPLAPIDRTNEWLKDNTYVDMFGWKDVVSDGRSAVKQVMLLGIMGDAYLARTRAGKEAVIFRGRPGLRARLPGTRYLRAHPIVKEAGFVLGRKRRWRKPGGR